MTAANFDRSLKLVLIHEGGYVNHPADPGGATNKGVTQATYNAYRRSLKLPTRSVREITDGEVAAIYRLRYWNAVHGDALPSGVDYAVFDFGVNSGPSRATEFLQRVLGVDDDGIMGPLTRAAAIRADPRHAIGELCDRRLAWLKGLRTWPTFGRGWGSRVAGVRREALALAADLPHGPIPEPVDESPSTREDDPGAPPRAQPDDPGVPAEPSPAPTGFWARLAWALRALFG